MWTQTQVCLTAKPLFITNTLCPHKKYGDASIAHNIFKTHALFFLKELLLEAII